MADVNSLMTLELNEDILENDVLDAEEDDITLFAVTGMFMRRALNRSLGFYEEIIPSYFGSEFQSHFRMTRTTFEILSREIIGTGQIPIDNWRGRAPIAPVKQVMIFLWCIANQECTRLVADRFNVTMSSVDRVLQRVAQALVHLTPTYIKWPNGRLITLAQVRAQIPNRFKSILRFFVQQVREWMQAKKYLRKGDSLA